VSKLLFAIFSVLLVMAGVIEVQADGVASCENCRTLREGIRRKVVPTKDPRCVPFVQRHRGDVMLMLKFLDGPDRPYQKKNAAQKDCIVVGRSWLRKATTKSFICNEREGHAFYDNPTDMSQIAEEPKFSPAHTACLLGKQECAARRFRILP